mgnify:CR=1 FL=1
MGELIGIIGDIHGCYLTFTSLYAELVKYTDEIYCVGDLIDRGKQSKDVIDFIIENKIKAIKGNHEDVLMKAFDAIGNSEKSLIEIFNHHFKLGGDATFESYRGNMKPCTIADYKKMVDDTGHTEYMKNLPLIFELPKVVISHAGIVKNATPEEIIWNRKKPLLKLNKLQVIGHTPQNEILYEKDWYMNIDTGCVYGNKLTAVVINKFTAETSHTLQLENIDVHE